MIAHLRELFHYKELMWNLVVRDLKVRYKNSVLGFLWSLLNPLLLMMVFTLVFTIMLPNFYVPHFPAFVLCALLPWNCFNTSVMTGISSIVGNTHLINKVYFPREILTLADTISNFLNFLFSIPVLFLFIALMGMPITRYAFYLPLAMLMQLLFTAGVSLTLATLNVYYRDTAVIMEVLMQAWFFLTPIFYPIDLLPESAELWGLVLPIRRMTYIVNPMASIVATYRSILYGFTNGSPPAAPSFDFLMRTLVTCILVFVIGYRIFYTHSKGFAEET